MINHCLNNSALFEKKVILKEGRQSFPRLCEEEWRAREDKPPVPATLNVASLMWDDREMSVCDIYPITFNHHPRHTS